MRSPIKNIAHLYLSMCRQRVSRIRNAPSEDFNEYYWRDISNQCPHPYPITDVCCPQWYREARLWHVSMGPYCLASITVVVAIISVRDSTGWSNRNQTRDTIEVAHFGWTAPWMMGDFSTQYRRLFVPLHTYLFVFDVKPRDGVSGIQHFLFTP